MKSEKLRSEFWKILLSTSAMAAAAVTIGLWLASTAGDRQNLKELKSAAETLADLIESIAHVSHQSGSVEESEPIREAILRQIAKGLAGGDVRDDGADLLIGRNAGGQLQLLRPTTDDGFRVLTQIAFENTAGLPMREALAGRTGSGEFVDYRGVPVLAAHAPVPSLAMGVVYKMDRSEARAPYHLVAAWASAAYLVMVGLLAAGYWRLTGRLERSVRHKEQRFTAVFQTAPVIMVVLSPDGVIEEVNPFYEQLTGWTLGELRGCDWFSRCLPARDVDATRTVFKSALSGALTDGHVNPIVTGSGEERQIEWRNQILRDNAGNISHMIAVGIDVTERMQASEALKENESRIRQVLDSLFGFVGLYTLDGTLIDANEAPLRAAGLQREDVLGHPFWDTYWWNYDGQVQAELKSAMARAAVGETVRYEPAVRVLGGALIVIDVTFGPLRDSAGVITHILGFAVDITERKQTEQALAESEGLLSGIMNGIFDGILMADARTGRITFANPAICRLLGYTATELLTRSINDLHPAESLQTVQQGFASIVSGSLPPVEEVKVLRKDGSAVSVEISGYGIEYNGRQYGVGVLRDVTEQRRVELELHESRARLVKAQRIAQLGSWELDCATGKLDWTDELYRIFEIDPTKFRVSYEAFLGTVHRDDREAVNAAYVGSLSSHQPYRIVHRLRMEDGRIKYVEEQCETEFAADGKPLRSRGTSQDVTERVLAEQALRRSLHEKETLLREIHHRVKNNLQIISSLLYFHSSKVQDSAAAVVFAEVRDRLRAMVLVHEKLYDSPNLSAVDFGEYVRALADQLLRSNDADRRIRLKVEAGQLYLPIEKALPCGMMLAELLTNLIKYAFPDGRHGEALVRLGRVDDSVQLLVRDNGVGLPADLDIDSTASFGWRLIRTLAQQLGGALEIEREGGLGVTIAFPLPKDQQDAG